MKMFEDIYCSNISSSVLLGQQTACLVESNSINLRSIINLVWTIRQVFIKLFSHFPSNLKYEKWSSFVWFVLTIIFIEIGKYVLGRIYIVPKKTY